MTNENLILISGLIAFIGFKFFKSYSIKKKLPNLMESGAVIIDVRSEVEFRSGHNPKSINYPLDQFSTKIQTLDKDKTYVLCCASGGRSGMALGVMKQNGFNKVINAGGWKNTLF